MRRTSIFCFALSSLLAAMIPNCANTGTETDNPMAPTGVELRRSSFPYEAAVVAPEADAEALRAGNRAFALTLFQEVQARAGSEENLFLGTHSVSTVLAMTFAGARGNTEAELGAAARHGLDQAALHPAMNALARELREGLEGTNVRFNALNSLWVSAERQIGEGYLDTLSQHYDTGVFLADFQNQLDLVRTRINSWGSEQTEGLIPELFGEGSISPETELVLTNAAYLSAPWQDRFDVERTEVGEFVLPSGEVVDAPFMGRVFSFPAAFDVDWRAFELPFRDADMGMVFVLPNEGEFEQFGAEFDAGVVEEILTKLDGSRAAPGQVWVRLPRFNFGSHVDLEPVLQGLGVVDLFDPGAADLRGIAPEGDLFVGGIEHRTTVAVDEDGITAAVATGEVLVPLSITPRIHLDRPFLFFVYDHRTESVLFVGRLVRPEGTPRAPTEPSEPPTDPEVICAGLATCAERTTTESQCLEVLARADAAVLEQCADCVDAAVDECGGMPPCDGTLGDVCEPATCAEHCPAEDF